MFIFGRCHCSLAAVTPAKYQYDSNNLTYYSMLEKSVSVAVVTPTPGLFAGPHGVFHVLLSCHCYMRHCMLTQGACRNMGYHSKTHLTLKSREIVFVNDIHLGLLPDHLPYAKFQNDWDTQKEVMCVQFWMVCFHIWHKWSLAWNLFLTCNDFWPCGYYIQNLGILN